MPPPPGIGFKLPPLNLGFAQLYIVYSNNYASQSIHLYNLITNHSMGRGYHVAWTPPSPPDSIVLLGGSAATVQQSSAAQLTAEIVSGI